MRNCLENMKKINGQREVTVIQGSIYSRKIDREQPWGATTIQYQIRKRIGEWMYTTVYLKGQQNKVVFCPFDHALEGDLLQDLNSFGFGRKFSEIGSILWRSAYSPCTAKYYQLILLKSLYSLSVFSDIAVFSFCAKGLLEHFRKMIKYFWRILLLR